MWMIEPIDIDHSYMWTSYQADVSYSWNDGRQLTEQYVAVPLWSAASTYAVNKVVKIDNYLNLACQLYSDSKAVFYDGTLTFLPNARVAILMGNDIKFGYSVSTGANVFWVSTDLGGQPMDLAYPGYTFCMNVTLLFHAEGLYQALQAVPAGAQYVPNAAPTYWKKIGRTNNYNPLDQTLSTQARYPVTAAGSTMRFNVATSVTQVFDSVALINCNAASVRLIQKNSAASVVYDKTYSLVKPIVTIDYWNWAFEPIVRSTDFVELDMQAYPSASIEVQLISGGAETLQLGAFIIGRRFEIGASEFGATVGIVDYSKKTADSFGSYNISQGSYSKRGDFSVWVDNTQIDALFNRLANYRATPIVWVGSGDFTPTVIYGFYKDFNLNIKYANQSLCTLQIEGLT